MTELLDEAADALERRVFFDRFAARYAELRHDANAWGEIETERAEESSSLSDRSARRPVGATSGSWTSANPSVASRLGAGLRSWCPPTR
jgi:hypothetical protein